MAEFKFNCPKCKGQIVCDASYAGSPINCPVCQQPITVPSAPAAPVTASSDSIHIKKSTLRAVALIALAVLVLAGLVYTGFYLFAGPRKLTFKTYVDGTDVIKLSGAKLWIEHQAWQPPVKITVNGKKWNPVWDGNTSTPYGLSRAFRPGNTASIKLTKQLGRGTVAIAEMPSPENQETLAINVDDGPYGGADWYEFTVTW